MVMNDSYFSGSKSERVDGTWSKWNLKLEGGNGHTGSAYYWNTHKYRSQGCSLNIVLSVKEKLAQIEIR